MTKQPWASRTWCFLLSGLCFVPALAGRGDETVDALVTLKTDILVPTQVAGVVGWLSVREGDLVEKKQSLARLDPTIAIGDYEAAQREADVFRFQKDTDIDIRYSKKSRDVSERELQRSLRANNRFAKSVSSTELERLQMLVDQADLSEEKARLDLDVADANFKLKQTLAKTAGRRVELHDITSPIRGMVVARMVNEGEWLDVGQPLLRVIQLDVLRVEANLDGELYGPDLIGSPVTLDIRTKTGKEQAYEGKVVFVSPELDPVDGMVRIWAEVQNPQRKLKPGMRGKLTVSVPPGDAGKLNNK